MANIADSFSSLMHELSDEEKALCLGTIMATHSNIIRINHWDTSSPEPRVLKEDAFEVFCVGVEKNSKVVDIEIANKR